MMWHRIEAIFRGAEKIRIATTVWQHAVSLHLEKGLEAHGSTLLVRVEAFAHLVRGWVFREPNVFWCERSPIATMPLAHLCKFGRSTRIS